MSKPFYKRPAAIILGLASVVGGVYGVEHVLDVRQERLEQRLHAVAEARETKARTGVYDLEQSLDSHAPVMTAYWQIQQLDTTKDQFVSSYAAYMPDHDKVKALAAYNATVGWGDAVGDTITTGINQRTPEQARTLQTATAKLADVDQDIVVQLLQPPRAGKRLSEHQYAEMLVELLLAQDELGEATALFDQNRDDVVISNLDKQIEYAMGVSPDKALRFDSMVGHSVAECTARIKLETTLASAVLRSGIADDDRAIYPVNIMVKASKDKDTAAAVMLLSGASAIKILEQDDGGGQFLPRPSRPVAPQSSI